VNTFFIFHILKIKIFKIWQCEHIECSIDCSFQTQCLQFVWFSINKIYSKKYFPHISYEICEINSIKINASRAFQQHQEHPQIPIQFLVPILLNFHWENGSIINSFHIVVPNNLKQSQYTPTHWELSKDTKSVAWSTMVWEILAWQNKTKCFAS
jgi:hypothetical protein